MRCLDVFAQLGLDVNPMYVQDLEEVYLNGALAAHLARWIATCSIDRPACLLATGIHLEFIKIADSHVPVPPAAEEPAPVDDNGDPNQLESLASLAATPLVPALLIADPSATKTMSTAGIGGPLEAVSGGGASGATGPNNKSSDTDVAPVLDEDALRQRQDQLWADEWKLVDTYRRGYVSMDELRLFLASCASVIPSHDLVRFFEMYGEPRASAVGTPGDDPVSGDGATERKDDSDDDEVFVLTKAGFAKFRKDYTEKDVPDSDRGLSSDEDDDDEGGVLVPDETARGGKDPSVADGSEADADKHQRHARHSSHQSGDGATSSRSHTSSHRNSIIIVDPGVLDQSDVSDDDDNDDGGENEDDDEAHDTIDQLPFATDELGHDS